tara:strand:+ start:13234 stop:20295 length:7062 start_codon:yes stop_codon:yes gene_type:complete
MAEELTDDELLSGSMLETASTGNALPDFDFGFDSLDSQPRSAGLLGEDDSRTTVSRFGEQLTGRLPPETELPLPVVDAEKFVAEAASYIRDGLADQGKTPEQIEREVTEILKNEGITVDNITYKVRGPSERLDEPTSIFAAGSRLLGGRRDISITPESFRGLTRAEMRIAETKKQSEQYQKLIDDFVGSVFSLDVDEAKETGSKLLRPVFEGAEPIKKEEIVGSGVDKEFKGLLGTIGDVNWFGRAPEDKDKEFFIPYIFKAPFTDGAAVAERIGEHVGPANIFAPMFVEPKDLENYKALNRLTLPTESYEPIVLRLEQAQDAGMKRDQIKRQLTPEFAKMLSVASYDDMPGGTQLNKPDIEVFKSFVDSDIDSLRQFDIPILREAIRTVTQGGSDAKLQKQLNRVPFGALPESVWAGTIPSFDPLLDAVLDDAQRVIDAKGEAGVRTRKFMAKLEQAMLEEVEVNNEVYVVESTFGKVLRLIGVAQELFLEARLPGDLPLTPASSDYYFNYGLRSPDAGYFARVLANVNTGNVGAQVHLTNEALAKGSKRGDREYQVNATVGALLDFLVPWEMMAAKPITAPTKSVYRGSRLARQFNMEGGWANPNKWKVFYAGATPALYNYVENVAVNVDNAVQQLRLITDGDLTSQSIQTVLRNDELVAEAYAAGSDVPLDSRGRELPRLGYTARRVTEEIKNAMDKGESFDAAVDAIKRDYKPDVFETVFHASQTFLYHTAHTEQGKKLFQRGADAKDGLLPFQVEQQVDRALEAAGFDANEVKKRALAHAQENGDRYLRNLKSGYVLGDMETLELRQSKGYKSAVAKIDDLIQKGQLDEQQKAVLLAILENRAVSVAFDKGFKAYESPENFFAGLKVKKVTQKAEDGTETFAGNRFQVGASRKEIFDMSDGSLNNVLETFRTGEFNRLLNNDAESIIDIMGRKWSSTFFGHVGSTENKAKTRKIARKLTKNGANEVEFMIRSMVDGSGDISGNARYAADLYHNLQAMFARFRGEANGVVPDSMIRGKIDNFLRPDLWFRNDLVDMNMRKYARSDQKVFVDDDIDSLLVQERRRKVGQKSFFDVDTHPSYVQQGVGISKDIKQVDALDLYTKTIAYVLAEDLKRRESRALIGGIDMVKLTGATATTSATAESVQRRVNARMATTLGIENHKGLSKRTYLDAKKLRGIADAKTETLTLNKGQQARFAVLLARMQSEPFIGRKIPTQLTGAGANLSKVSFEDYNQVIKLMLDLEGGPVSRRSLYSDRIPKSLGYALFRTMKNSTLDFSKELPGVREVLKQLDETFNLKTPMDDAVRPEFREIIRRRSKNLQNIRSELIETARKARKEDPEATINDIYDKLRNVIKYNFTDEQVDLIVGTDTRDGIGSLLTDLTDVEKKRIGLRFAQQEAKKRRQRVPESARLTRDELEVLAGSDEILSQSGKVAGLDAPDVKTRRYQFEIPGGVSRIQFLTSVEGARLLEKATISLGGYKSVDDRLAQALATIRTFVGDDGVGLTPNRIKKELKDDSTRIALMDAFNIVNEKIENHKRVIKGVSNDIFESITGGRFSRKLDEEDVAKTYKAFFRGDAKGGWESLYELATDYGARTDVARQSVSDFSPAQAFLEMIGRLRARDEMLGLYDELVRFGMPAARENYYIPETKIGPNGAKYSIDTPHQFYQRVQGHMKQIASKRGDIITYERVTQEDGSVVTKVKKNRASIPDYASKFAAFEERPAIAFSDIQAMIAAEEALVRFGKRNFTEGDLGFEVYTFAGGEEAYVPTAMVQELQAAVNRAAGIGKSFGGASALALRMDNVGTPGLKDLPQDEIPLNVALSNKVGRALRQLGRLFPMSMSLIKQGITTGFVIPIVPYYVANFLGGAFQLSTAVGPIDAARIMGRNARFNASVTKRLFGKNQYMPPPNKLIITKTGEIYTVNQVSDMALLYGLDSSFIQAETMTSMADDIEKYIRKDQSNLRFKKVTDFTRAWNDHLKEVATAIDNYYRVSIFTNELVEGKSPVQAASLARKAAFDYGALTEREKTVMRNAIMFYSYLRNNMNLFYDTLLTRPDRVINQLRLANGLQQVNLEGDPQVAMNRFLEGRLAVNFNNAFQNLAEKDQRMYVMPPLPIMDSINLVLDTYDAFGQDKEARRMLLTRLVPWLQAPLVAATDLDLFYGKNIDRFNRISPWLVEWDLGATGGVLKRTLDFEEYTYRNPALRQVEGDDDRPITIAKNGMDWYILRNMVQLPPFGRYATLFDAADRADLGVVEGTTEMVRTARRFAEDEGLVERVSDDFKPGDTLSPRVGYTRFDEALALFGLRVYVTDTSTQARERLFDKLMRQYKSQLPRYSAGDTTAQAVEKIIVDPIDD